MNDRISADEYFLRMAALVATRGTCIRRQVGCVLVNHRKHVLATGFSGVAAGLPHCTDFPCPGANLPSGTGLDKCHSIHSEQNSLLQCRDVYEIDTCYITHSPCIHCTKLLMNTSTKRIVFTEEYAHNTQSKELWAKTGRIWQHYGYDL
jgi:dCMP deaminase